MYTQLLPAACQLNVIEGSEVHHAWLLNLDFESTDGSASGAGHLQQQQQQQQQQQRQGDVCAACVAVIAAIPNPAVVCAFLVLA
jgi:hypothetical protein